jgi:SAM-dependent methyltransferase
VQSSQPSNSKKEQRLRVVDNKDHWYDGRFYDVCIAPNQDRVFRQIGNLISDQSSVLDVGCGTGRLAFQLADKCTRIDGVDLSRRNVEIARQKLAKRPSGVIAFHHADILHFLKGSGREYDYSVLTYVLHEMQIGDRISTVHALAAATRRLIIVDYLVPQPRTLTGVLNTLVERAAGQEHYRNFRTFTGANGLAGLLRGAGLTIVEENRGSPAGAHIVVARGDHQPSP